MPWPIAPELVARPLWGLRQRLMKTIRAKSSQIEMHALCLSRNPAGSLCVRLHEPWLLQIGEMGQTLFFSACGNWHVLDIHRRPLFGRYWGRPDIARKAKIDANDPKRTSSTSHISRD